MRRASIEIATAMLCAATAGCGDDSSSTDGPPCLCDAPDFDADPQSAWQPRAPTRAIIQETAVVAVGNQMYVLGGFEGPGATIVDKAQIYNPSTNAWSDGPSLPAAVHHANAVVVGGTIFVIGDLRGGFASAGDVWSFNPSTDADWSTNRMLMNRPRGASVAGEIDGIIYVAGGLDGGSVDEVDAYDIANDMWTTRASLPAPRDHGCGAVIGGKLYYAGGRNGGITGISNLVWEYDPITNMWTDKAPMPTARGGTACGVIDGKLIVVGGEGNPASGTDGVFPQTERYDPVANTWETLEPMTNPRHGMGAAAIDGMLYVPGGADQMGFGAVATHDVFTPPP
jgi:N-acetylneuraminic acid mutarotase